MRDDNIREAVLFLSMLRGCEVPSSAVEDVEVEDDGKDSSFGSKKSLDNELLF